jgi:5-methylcytosine-specific restriction endonuclease McrA
MACVLGIPARERKGEVMGMRPLRMCCKCLATALPGTSYCAAHTGREINRWRVAPPHNHSSKAWRQAREECFYRYNDQCAQLDGSGTRCLNPATEAHHIVPWQQWVKQGNDYLDQDNLVALCKACHARHTVAERTGHPLPVAFAPPDNGASSVI